jgi:phage baseplate assembly protein W
MAKQAAGINFKWPLHAGRKGFFASNRDTLAAVREDIRTLVLTKKGERMINPDIGTNMGMFAGELFEQIDKPRMKAKFKAEIESALADWMPHVRLTGLELVTIDDPKGRKYALRDNDLLILMDYVLDNAEALGDSIQLTIST